MRTLRFTINSQDIDMSDTKVNYSRTNPLFETVGSYTLPFKFVRNPLNDSIMQSSSASDLVWLQRYNASVFIGPVEIKGEFIRQTTNDQFHEGYFTSGNSTFRDTVKGTKLSDIDYTETIDAGVGTYHDELTLAAASSYPTYNYTCFPMLMPNYYKEGSSAIFGVINLWFYDPLLPQGGKFIDTVGIDPENKLPFAPSFYLCFVIEKIFSEYGYVINTNELYDDAELRTLVIANYNTVGSEGDGGGDYLLKFENALPVIEINDYIKGLESNLNITFHIDEISKIVNIKKNTNTIKSVPTRVLKLVTRKLDFEDVQDGFTLHMEMDGSDDFAKIEDIVPYTLGITVDSKDDLDLPANAADNYKNQLAFISYNDRYYISSLTDSGAGTWSWLDYTGNYFDYIDAGAQLALNTKANTILMDDYFIFNSIAVTEFAYFPRIDNTVFDESGKKILKTFDTLRLLFYRGIVDGGGLITDPSTVDSKYPLASSDVYRAQGVAGAPPEFGRVKIPAANQELRWDGAYGLYEKNWKDYLYWFITLRKSATDIYELTLEELFSILMYERYQADDVSIIFRSMEIKLDFNLDVVTVGNCDVYIG